MRTVFRVLLFPIAVILDVFTWICCGRLSCSAFVFSLACSLVSILAVAVMLTCSVTNGLILLIIAFVVSPMGLPMIAAWVLSGLQNLSMTIKGY